MNEIDKYKQILIDGSKSSHTIKAYMKDANRLIKHFKITNIYDLEKITADQYYEFYRSLNISDNSINALIRNLSAFFTYLQSNEIVTKENAFYKVVFNAKDKFKKIAKKKKVILTVQEATMLINAGRNMQEKFMLKLMLTTALRRDEICNIKLSDISGCSISIKSKGGDEDAETYLDDDLCAMLNEYILERDTESQYLFYGTRGFDGSDGKLTGTSVNNRVRACVALSEIPEEKKKVTTAHRLRAYAITRMYLKKGKPAAQALARHKSDKTTDIYIVAGNDFVKELLLGETQEEEQFVRYDVPENWEDRI